MSDLKTDAAYSIVGEVETDEIAQRMIDLSKVSTDFAGSYAKCTCRECGKNFKYRMDSLELRFGTCPWCGFANTYEEMKQSLKSIMDSLFTSISSVEGATPVDIPLTDQDAELVSIDRWPAIRSELSKYSRIPFTVKCDESWNTVE